MKYTLIIEGFRGEIERAEKDEYTLKRWSGENTDCVIHEIKPEFKIIEPFKYSFEVEVDHMGQVPITRGQHELVYQLDGNLQGKRVKVTIEEVTK